MTTQTQNATGSAAPPTFVLPVVSRYSGLTPTLDNAYPDDQTISALVGMEPTNSPPSTSTGLGLNRRLLDYVAPEIPKTARAVEDAANAAAEASKSLTQLLTTLRDLFETIPIFAKYVQKLCDAIALIYDIVVDWLKEIYAHIPTYLYRLLMLFDVPAYTAKQTSFKLLTLFSSIEPNQDPRVLGRAEQQGAEVETLFTALSSLTGLLLLSRHPSKEELRDVNEKLKFASMMQSTGQNLGHLFMAFIQYLPDVVKAWAQFIVPTKWWLNLFEPGSQYYDWMTQVEKLDIAEVKERAAYDLELQQLIIQLHTQGQSLLKDCSVGPQYSKIFTLLRDKMKVIDDLFDIVDISSLSKRMRPTPFCCYLTGDAGRGKSFLNSILPPILAGTTDDTNLKYPRSAAVDHWDGYTGQFATVYDDFYARKPGQEKPGEIAEVIGIVSNEIYPLSMAALEHKGATFRSRVVLISSNTAFPRDNTMIHAPALYRRRHVMYHIDVHDQFKMPVTGNLDVSRIPMDNSHYKIRKYQDPGNDASLLGPELNYQQFIEDVKTAYQTHVAREALAVSNAKRMVEDAVRAEHQGILTDMLDQTFGDSFHSRLTQGIAIAGVAAYGRHYIPKWYTTLQEEAKKEEPEWFDALVTGAKLVATVAGTGWFFWKMATAHKKEKTEKEVAAALRPVHYKMKSIMHEGRELTELDAEHRVRSALGCFRGLIPPDELEALIEHHTRELVKKCAIEEEGAYGFVKGGVAAPRPVVVRPSAEGQQRNANRSRLSKRLNNDLAEPEGSTDDNAIQVATSAVCPALVYVQSAYQTNQGLFIRGRILMVPLHQFRDSIGYPLKPGSTLQVFAPGVSYTEQFDPNKLISIGPDIGLYCMESLVKTWKDITHHFWNDSDLMAKPIFDAIMISMRGQAALPSILHFPCERLDMKLDIGHAGSDFLERGGLTMYENQGFLYDFPTRKGDCGGVLLALDPHFSKKIFGMHIAGVPKKNLGVAAFVSIEMIQGGLNRFAGNPLAEIIGTTPRGPYESKLDAVRATPQGNFTFYGQLTKTLYQSTRTKIIPSLIHGQIFPPTTFPSVLSHKDPRMLVKIDPMIKGVEKYGNKAVMLDKNLVRRVSLHLTELFNRWDRHMEPEVVDLNTAINGNANYEFADGIVMDTSAGYPYNQRPKKLPGKHDLFDGGPGNYKIIDNALQILTDIRWTKALKGEMVPSLWLDCLKDERRSLEKIVKGKTRVFTIPPLDFTLCFRRLTLAFSATFYKNALKFFSAVGMDPESLDWTLLYHRHARVSKRGFAGDYSGYDGNLSPQLIMECCEIINRWYDDDDCYQRARRVMFEEIVHTPQAFGNLVYATHIGNPSGNPLTAIMNTIIGAMYLRYTWLKLAPPKLASLTHYEENVVDTVYGDDGIITVSDKAKPFFNPDNVSKVLRSMGMEFTATSKDRAAAWENLCDMSFLKRGFRKGDQKRWLPIIDKQTIQELTNWVRQSDFVDPKAMLVDNCNNALRFAFFYGKAYFDELRNKILRVFSEASAQLHDYEYYYIWFYDPNPGRRPLLERAEFQSMNILEMENAKGVISLSQRTGTEDSGSPEGAAANSQLAAQCISDPAWSLPEMAQRRVLFDVYSWSTSQSFQTVITKQEAPSDFLVARLQTTAFERFMMWNGSMTIEIHVNGTRFHAGRLIAYFVPWTRKSITPKWHEVDMAAAWCVPNVFIDASTSNPATLNIPFYNPRSALYINGPKLDDLDYTGTFILQVLSPLTASSGTATTINVNVWVKFNIDNEFRVPANTNLPSSTFNEKHLLQKLQDAGLNERMIEAVRAEMRAEHQGTTNSTQNITTYGNVDSQTVPTNMKGNEIGSGNDFSVPLPMDKPARSANPVPVYHVGFQQLATTVGSEHVRRMDLNPSLLNESVAEMFGSMADEMILAEMLQRPTYCGAFTWGASASQGTLLQARWIGPMSSYFQNNSQSQISMTDGVALNVPLLDYICAFFGFWRGSFKIRFDFVATQMHTGRVFIAANYGAPADTSFTLRDATSQYGVEFDLNNEEHNVEFEIPQNVVTPWMKVCRGPRDTSSEYTNNWFMQYFYGSWSMVVVDALVAPDNVAPDISIIWSIAAGSDFRLYYPMQSNESLIPDNTTEPSESVTPPSLRRRKLALTDRAEHQGDTQEGTDAAPVPTVVDSILDDGLKIAPPGAAIKMPLHHFGAKAPITHLGDVVKRYYAVTAPLDDGGLLQAYPKYYAPGLIGGSGIQDVRAGFTINFAGAGTGAPAPCSNYLFYWFEPVQPFSDRMREGRRNPLSYWGRMYRFWRGGMRYKMLWDGVTDYAGNPLQYGACGAVYLPGELPLAVSGSPNLAAIANRYASVLEPTTLTSTSIYSYSFNNSALAADTCSKTAQYNEVEIPFTHQFNVLPTEVYLTANQREFQSMVPGNILFIARFAVVAAAADTQANLQNYGLSRWPRLFKAFGDDARFGTWLGVPQVVPRNTFVVGSGYLSGPYDTWSISPPAREGSSQPTKSSLEKQIADAAQLGVTDSSGEDSDLMTDSVRVYLQKSKKLAFRAQHQGLGASSEQYTAVQGLPQATGFEMRASMFNARMTHYTLVGAVISLHLNKDVLKWAERLITDQSLAEENASVPAHIITETVKSVLASTLDPQPRLLQAYEYLAKTFGFRLKINIQEDSPADNTMLRVTLNHVASGVDSWSEFRLPRKYAGQVWDFARLSFLQELYENAHDYIGSAYTEAYQPTEMFFLTENIPIPDCHLQPPTFPMMRDQASRLAGLTRDARLEERLRQGIAEGVRLSTQPSSLASRIDSTDRAEHQGDFHKQGMLEPTTQNIVKVLQAKLDDVIAKRKPNIQAWNEFKQSIPVKEEEKDTQIGPEHAPRFFHERKTECSNRHWKGVEACSEGSTKKEARDASAREILQLLRRIYIYPREPDVIAELDSYLIPETKPCDTPDSPDIVEEKPKVVEPLSSTRSFTAEDYLKRVHPDVERKTAKSPPAVLVSTTGAFAPVTLQGKEKFLSIVAGEGKDEHVEPEAKFHFGMEALSMYKEPGELLKDIDEGGPFWSLCLKAEWVPHITVDWKVVQGALKPQRVWQTHLVMVRNRKGIVDSAQTYHIYYVGQLTTAALDTMVRTAFAAFFSSDQEFAVLNESKVPQSLTQIRRQLELTALD